VVEKRGETEPEDLSDNLVVQLGVATEPLNRIWYERNAGRTVTDIQRRVRHPVQRYLAATLDGFVNDLDAVFEAKCMLPWSFSEEAAAEKHMAQLQHNMWVTNAQSTALSIITGGGMGRADHTRRRPLSALSGDGGEAVLALRSDRGHAAPLWRRAASASDRSGSHCRHERVQFLGRVRGCFLRHAIGFSRP
jgi:hypothetical protein